MLGEREHSCSEEWGEGEGALKSGVSFVSQHLEQVLTKV